MVLSLSDYHQVDQNKFLATGAFDPILTIDTRLFIDPRLIHKTRIPEFEHCPEQIAQYFARAMKLVKRITKRGDVFWKEADRLLTFPEVNGLCIGYSNSSDSGSGMGPGLRAELLTNVQQIVEAGNDDPELFELVGIFQDKIGPDRISDMIAKIISSELIAFTQRVCSDCGIPMESVEYSKGADQEDLPVNPVTGAPIILVPKEILSELPVAENYADVRIISEHNQNLRDEFNAMVGGSLSAASAKEKKRLLRHTFVNHPNVLAGMIKSYLALKPEFYDFDDDPAGEVVWYRASKSAVAENPLGLMLPASPSLADVERVVLIICEQFRNLIEYNQLAKLLYDKGKNPKHESAAQLLFFGIAASYCLSNGLDLSPESDAGRGPVDFKISSGLQGKVLVEVKLTSNPKLLHGFEVQLPIYLKAENTTRGIYLVIDNGGCTQARMLKFREAVANAGNEAPKVIIVDGSIRPSASTAKTV